MQNRTPSGRTPSGRTPSGRDSPPSGARGSLSAHGSPPSGLGPLHGPRCLGTTTKGVRCKNTPIHGLEYCRLHVPEGAGAGADTPSPRKRKPHKRSPRKKTPSPPFVPSPPKNPVEALRAFLKKAHVNLRLSIPALKFAQRSEGREVPISWRDAIRLNPNKALIIAAKTGNVEMAEMALAAGADVNFNDQPLYMAAINGHTKMVEFLLDRGADINAQEGMVFLHAAASGHLAVLRLLVKRGINLNIEGEFPVEWAVGAAADNLGTAEHDRYPPVIIYLLETMPDAFVDQQAMNHPMLLAVAGNDVEVVKLLLDRGANAFFNDGFALVEAAKKRDTRLLRLLLEFDYWDPFIQNQALSIAQELGNKEAVRLLRMSRYELLHERKPYRR